MPAVLASLLPDSPVSWAAWACAALAAPVILLFFGGLLLIPLFEQRRQHELIRVPQGLAVCDSAYLQRAAAQFLHLGWQYGGHFYHWKHPRVQVLGSVFQSPDARTLAVCGAGTVLNVETHRTTLYTPLGDGTFLVTTDGNHIEDDAGCLRGGCVINGPPWELIESHDLRLVSEPMARRWMARDPWEALQELERAEMRSRLARGYARWHDESQAEWRGTIRRGLANVLGFPPKLLKASPQSARVDEPVPDRKPPVPLREQIEAWKLGRAPMPAPGWAPAWTADQDWPAQRATEQLAHLDLEEQFPAESAQRDGYPPVSPSA